MSPLHAVLACYFACISAKFPSHSLLVSRSLLDESFCRRLEGMATLILVLSCFESFLCFTITSFFHGVPSALLRLMTSCNLCLAFCAVLPCSLASPSATVLSQALLLHPCCYCHLQFLLLRCTALSAGAPASSGLCMCRCSPPHPWCLAASLSYLCGISTDSCFSFIGLCSA